MFNISVEDVASRWISTTPIPENNIVATYIEDATTLIEVYYPNIYERLENEKDLNKRLKVAVSQMVIRALQNPDKIRQQQESAGSFSGGVTYGNETLSGLEITEAEKKLLAPVNVSRNKKIFYIQPEKIYENE